MIFRFPSLKVSRMALRTWLAAALALVASAAAAFDSQQAPRYDSPNLYRPNVDDLIINGMVGTTPTALSVLFSDRGRSALYGVKCDGATGTDNTAAINRMSAALSDAQLPPGVCRITDTLVVPVGRALRGAGATATTLYVRPDFKASVSGVVRLAGAGSKFLDLGIDFAQPDTGARAALNRYPAAIDARGSGGGWTIDRVRVAHATKTLDMRGEQGQSKIGLLETSFFELGVDIDGSTDSVNVGTLRFWTYGFTPNQYQVLLDGNTSINNGQGMIGLNTGRMDGLVIDSFFSIFYPKAIRAYYSAGYNGDKTRNGITTAVINKMQLDTTGGLVCDWCDFSISTFYNNIGYSGHTAIALHGGNINIGQLNLAQFGANGNKGQAAPATETPLILVDDFSAPAPQLTISGMIANQGSVDRSLLSATHVNGAAAGLPQIQIAGLSILKDPTKAYTKPVFDVPGATGSVSGMNITDLTTGSGVLFNAPNDNPLSLLYSHPLGWTNTLAANPVRLNVNFGFSGQSLTLPAGSIYVGGNVTSNASVIGAGGIWTGAVASPTRVIDGSQNVKANMFGANGAMPVGKCALSAALPTDGSATNAEIATAINALRSCSLTNGLAQ